MYFTVPDHVWAIDARSGREIWHHAWQSQGGIHIGNRGVGILGDTLYVETADCNLVALNLKDGKEKWRKTICDLDQFFFGSTAPIIVKNHVITGISGDDLDRAGYIQSHDPVTGNLQWRWYVVPQKPGEPGSETWPNEDAMKHGGGMTWQPVTYDPELNLIYVPTGNPQPVIAHKNRAGANLFTESIVGAPAYNLTGFHFAFIWNARAMFPDPNNLSQPVVSNQKLKLLEAKVLAKCDAIDGLQDGLIENPRACKFGPAKDLPVCVGAESDDCFTARQIATLQKIYGGARNSKGQLYPGFHPGVESGWNTWLGEGVPNIKPLGPNLSYAYGEGFLRYWIYDNPNYKLHQFDFDKNIGDTRAAAKLVNADNPNLKAFQQRGGKIIFYHGWADNAFPAAATIQYYEQMQRVMGGKKKTDTFARLFLVPGMLHCAGGPGCHQADYLTALDNWVEQGNAPDAIIGTGTNPVRTRPLCAYPQIAKYKGSGDVNDAANFNCVESK